MEGTFRTTADPEFGPPSSLNLQILTVPPDWLRWEFSVSCRPLKFGDAWESRSPRSAPSSSSVGLVRPPDDVRFPELMSPADKRSETFRLWPKIHPVGKHEATNPSLLSDDDFLTWIHDYWGKDLFWVWPQNEEIFPQMWRRIVKTVLVQTDQSVEFKSTNFDMFLLLEKKRKIPDSQGNVKKPELLQRFRGLSCRFLFRPEGSGPVLQQQQSPDPSQSGLRHPALCGWASAFQQDYRFPEAAAGNVGRGGQLI